TPPTETLARISYQRFFSRYLHLCGMTGTANEAAAELHSVYNIKVAGIPTHRPSQLADHGTQLFANTADKWQELLRRTRELHQQGRPVLIGTRTVEDSERVSKMFAADGLAHRVLNARQDQEEAELVGKAGHRGSITIATNMAGRGTDIPLGPGVEALGGLHVIAVERNESRRIDRQLFGRSARQGAPGSAESILSLEDDIIRQNCPKYLQKLAVTGFRGRHLPAAWKHRMVLATCQISSEAKLRRARRALERMDEYLGKILSFSGLKE
ncbi:MAG: prepilin peptidase, partial [Gammaproteobacteria bacterium]|nr:prepilin peptidase [Gammaproteobacteria bacterium]